MRCPPRRHLPGLSTHATQQYLDLRVQRARFVSYPHTHPRPQACWLVTPPSPFFFLLIDGCVEVFDRVGAWMQYSFLVLEGGLELPQAHHPTCSVGLPSLSCSLTLQVIHTPPHLALLAGSGVGFASSRKREHLCVFYGGSLPTLIDDVRLCCRPPLLSSSQSNLCTWDFCDMGTVADLRTCSTLLLSMFIYHKPLPLSTAFRSS